VKELVETARETPEGGERGEGRGPAGMGFPLRSQAGQMDIQRPDLMRAHRRRRVVLVSAAIGALLLVALLLARVGSSVPAIERASLVIDRVSRGELVREVRAAGALVPEQALLIAAEAPGRVLKVCLAAGALVTPETTIIKLANPEVEQASLDAASRLLIAEAELTTLQTQLDSQAMTLKADTATLESDWTQAQLRFEATDRLAREGLASSIDLRIAQARLTDIRERFALQREREVVLRRGAEAQRVAKEAEVSARRNLAKLRREQLSSLNVRARMSGILQSVSVEPGQDVLSGVPLARVAEPSRLIARLRVPASQARDVAPGLKVTVGIGSAVATGLVTRVDPAVKDAVVAVDVSFAGELPAGARPDLPVDGTIEIERLADVLRIDRPALSQENATAFLFRLEPGGAYARRVQVRLGRASVRAVEVREGLTSGEDVILSDMSGWAKHDRLRLK
jgi:HlyD family secretion protein